MTIGKGTTIGYGIETGGTQPTEFTLFANVDDVNMPEIAAAGSKIDASDYDTVDFKPFLSPGYKEVSDIDMSIIYEASQTTTIVGMVCTEQWFQITLPGGATWTFPGYISKLGGSIPKDNLVKQKCTIAVIGEAVFAAGTP